MKIPYIPDKYNIIQFSEPWTTYSSRFIRLLWLVLIIFMAKLKITKLPHRVFFKRLKIFKRSALQIHFRFAVVNVYDHG